MFVLNLADNDGNIEWQTNITTSASSASFRGLYFVGGYYYLTTTLSPRGIYKYDMDGVQIASYTTGFTTQPSYLVYDNSSGRFYVARGIGSTVDIIELDTDLAEISTKTFNLQVASAGSLQALTLFESGKLMMKYQIGTGTTDLREALLDYSSGTEICNVFLHTATLGPTSTSTFFGGYPNIYAQGSTPLIKDGDRYLVSRGDITSGLTGYLSWFNITSCSYDNTQQDLLYAKVGNGMVETGNERYYVFTDSYNYNIYYGGGASNVGTGIYLAKCGVDTCDFSDNVTISSDSSLGVTIGREIHSAVIGDGSIITWSMNPVSYTVKAFKTVILAPACTPSWVCSQYNACGVSNTRTCYAVADLNSCGSNYTGNGSEFTQSCVYPTPPAADIVYVTEQEDPQNVTDLVIAPTLTVTSSTPIIDFTGESVDVTNIPEPERIIVRSNFISIDTVANPELDRPATVRLTGISPGWHIYYDGSYNTEGTTECTAPRCTNIVYDEAQRTLTFDVSGFSTYYVGSYTKSDLPNIVVDGIGTAGASIVSWIELVITLGVLSLVAYGVTRWKK